VIPKSVVLILMF